MSAWDDRIPHYVTNSKVIAESYADLVISFFLEHEVDLSEPVYLLELGSGTGRFAYHFTRELLRKQAYFEQLAGVRFCVVPSDIVEDNVAFWESHPGMQALGDNIDFALYWPERYGYIYLRKSGLTLDSVKNPLVVMANYLFDSLPHDEFDLINGQVHECLIDLVPKAELSHSSPGRLDIRDVEVHRSYQKIEVDDYYSTPSHRSVLQHYAQEVKEGSVMVPVGALDCLDNLRKIGPLFLLSSDRAFVDAETMAVYPNHPHATHEGCFSHMVNFHALALTFQTYFATRRYLLDGVQTVCMSDFPARPQLSYAFLERVDRGNHLNNVNELYAIMRNKPPFFLALMGFVRLNLNDPNALTAVAKNLAEMSSRLSYDEHQELVRMLEQVWENDYYFKGSANVTFWIAHLYQQRGLYEKALDFFRHTVDRQGEDAMLLFLQGNCWQQLGQKAKAKRLFKDALRLAPGMPEALQGLALLKV